MTKRRSKRRGVTQLTWDDFPRRRDEQGWHCRNAGRAKGPPAGMV